MMSIKNHFSNCNNIKALLLVNRSFQKWHFHWGISQDTTYLCECVYLCWFAVLHFLTCLYQIYSIGHWNKYILWILVHTPKSKSWKYLIHVNWYVLKQNLIKWFKFKHVMKKFFKVNIWVSTFVWSRFLQTIVCLMQPIVVSTD